MIVFQVIGLGLSSAHNIVGYLEDGSIPVEDMSGFLEDGDNMINTIFFCLIPLQIEGNFY